MTGLAIVGLKCSVCHPELERGLTTICERHLLELNQQPVTPPMSCDICEPKIDDRLGAICETHLLQLVGGAK